MKKILWLLPLLAACTQQPVKVENRSGAEGSWPKAKMVNGRYGKETYIPPASEPMVISEPAGVDSIGVSELPPATGAAVQVQKAPFAPAQALKPPASMPFEKEKPPLQEQEVTHVMPLEEKTAPKPVAQGSMQWPSASRKILTPYNSSTAGVTIATESGEPVFAAEDGEVISAGTAKANGTTIILKQGSRKTTYARLQQAKVEKYARVSKGDIIGYSGKEVFFSVQDGEKALDPEKLIK